MAIATTEPAVIYAGDTLEWKISNSDYLASAGWSLRYVLIKTDEQIIFTSTASGDDHLISAAKAVTALYDPGKYDYRAYFYSSTEQHHYRSGVFDIRANYALATSGGDFRSHAKKVLDAIEAVLEGRATQSDLSIKVGDRSISRLTPAQLVEWRNFYRQEYQNELDEQAFENDDEMDNKTLYGIFK